MCGRDMRKIGCSMHTHRAPRAESREKSEKRTEKEKKKYKKHLLSRYLVLDNFHSFIFAFCFQLECVFVFIFATAFQHCFFPIFFFCSYFDRVTNAIIRARLLLAQFDVLVVRDFVVAVLFLFLFLIS